jgi:SAM-dependent methyltransferase
MEYAPSNAVLTGLERSEEAVRLACARGIRALASNLDEAWPVDDQAIDIVTSNQVIEHVADTDHFVRETLRVLRPGGTAVISTENLASWHNLAALSLGWQPFSITNVSEARPSIGNPLSNLRHGENLSAGWQHVRVFAYRGLVELFQAHGFVDVSITGSGYYPLPAAVGRWDPRHAAFITVIARRAA